VKKEEEEKRAEIRKERKIYRKQEKVWRGIKKEKTSTTRVLSSLSDCNSSLHRRR
jgi:CRISPR/Cas system-associated endonuclease Cas3-HD